MRLLRFLSRVAFICNICFLLATLTRFLPMPDNGLTSNIIILGYLLSIMLNVLVNTILLLLLLFGRLRRSGVPIWLLIINFIFFIIQIALLIINRHLQ